MRTETFIVEAPSAVIARFRRLCRNSGLHFWARPVLSGSPSPDDEEEAEDGEVAPLLLRLERTAQVLDVSPTTVKRLIKSGELAAVKVNGATRIRTEDLRAYVERLGESEDDE